MNRSVIAAATIGILGVVGVAAIVVQPNPQTAPSSAQVAIDKQTVSFAIENMYCALCPLTVEAAMERVVGVIDVSVSYETQSATVIFDASLTTPETIGAASTDVGYPAHLENS